jgi:hypothetical protein
MKDKDFENIMDSWAERETASAPEMQPTAEMFRLVQARQEPSPVSLFRSRRVLAAAAFAGLTLFLVLYAVLLRPAGQLDGPSGQAIAAVGLREGFAADNAAVVKTTPLPQEKGKGRGPATFEQLVFQYQIDDTESVLSVNFQSPQEGVFTLTAADNYRLLLTPAQDRYIYVFQSMPTGVLVQLFPNQAFGAEQNPLRREQMVILPSEPNWFHLGAEEGQEQIYVIAASRPVQGLQDLYTRYTETEDAAKKQALLSSLLETLASLQDTRGENVVGWSIVLNHE